MLLGRAIAIGVLGVGDVVGRVSIILAIGKIWYTTPFFIQSGVLKPGIAKKSPEEGSLDVMPAALSHVVAEPSLILKR